MNDMRYYRDLLTNDVRVDAFRRAIHAVVRPGDVVLDVGTGLGTYAFFAAEAGAGRVYAVESDPVVHVARTVGRLAGYTDRVEFVRGRIPDVLVPEPVDVVVFEDFPPRLLDARVARLLSRVKAQWAKPECRFVPRGATLFAAPVRSEPAWRRALSLGESESRYGVDWSATREYAANLPLTLWLRPDDLAAPAATLAGVEMAPAFDAATVVGRAAWKVASTGPVHGLAYWFSLDLADGVSLSNAPGDPGTSWGQLFLPFDPPLEATAGAPLEAEVGPESFADGLPAWLRWSGTIGPEQRHGHEFAAAPASLSDLAGLSPDGVPVLSSRGRREAWILAMVDGRRTVAEIAQELVRVGEARDLHEAERLVAAAVDGKIGEDRTSTIGGGAK